ncbi:ribosomal protein L35 [Mycoplasma haemofelis str. Langford 1]|uniref:Large ribosomal subunit protein bL35 n=3 Tax=Mycoplasma TaxID=2093 RepID=H6N5K1_MYCHN|nr:MULTISPECIES: 50S ribosomal protein L35 [Mycoplasma]AEG72418.1 50S ribosomal protein L35 [Mycoplasma haemofelis Ohio2]AEW44961.1 50S ribosomal protein L35 [Mycoplasma haemocanis str. Illinois]CBY92105.1 ribosomal protein L35 [Mycoplasma haemofelis str. Langford 1]
MKKPKKIKIKTKKAFSKRILVLGNGKMKRKHSHRSHLASNKSTKQKRQARSSVILNKAQVKRAYQLLQG